MAEFCLWPWLFLLLAQCFVLTKGKGESQAIDLFGANRASFRSRLIRPFFARYWFTKSSAFAKIALR